MLDVPWQSSLPSVDLKDAVDDKGIEVVGDLVVMNVLNHGSSVLRVYLVRMEGRVTGLDR